MPTKIDSIGTYTGEVLESSISTTKNGFPQWVARLKVDQKYVEAKEELEHFKLIEPQYVDYSPFDYEDIGYFCLFNNDGPLLSYEQVQLAVGWDGAAFDTLPTVAAGKKVLFRVEENEYNGKTSLKIQWIDHVDASPTRTLKAMDANEVKALSAKFITKKPAAKPAKPGAAKPTVPTSSGSPAVKPAGGAAKPSATAAPVAGSPATTTTAPASTTSTKKGVPAKKTPPTSTPVSTDATLPAETTQLDAWEYVSTHKGENSDDAVQDAWIKAGEKLFKDKADSDYTPADWAALRDEVIATLRLS